MKKIEITWWDSTFEKTGWEWVDEIKENAPIMEPMYTLGYLVEKTKDYILVCQSFHPDPKKRAGYDRGSEFFKIPLGCIRKIRFLK